MRLIELIDKLITERGSAAILERHLALVREQAELELNKVTQLEQEKAALEKRVSDLEAELKTYRDAEQFVPHRGALFQRKSEGNYDPRPICPNCRLYMGSPYSGVVYHCCSCGHTAEFDKDNLKRVISQLP